MSYRRWHLVWVAVVLAALCWACRGENSEPIRVLESIGVDIEEPIRSGAHPEIVEALRESLAASAHSSDGAGRAWLEDPEFAIAGAPGRFTLVFEVGPEGIAVDGMIQLLVSPFWGWSTPQIEIPELLGYTTVTPSADDIELETTTMDQQLLGMRVVGRALDLFNPDFELLAFTGKHGAEPFGQRLRNQLNLGE